MIALLPVVILGVPLILAFIDLVATRSGNHERIDAEPTPGRYAGAQTRLRRVDVTPPAVHRTTSRHDVPANVS
jgi:hypothetical protein